MKISKTLQFLFKPFKPAEVINPSKLLARKKQLAGMSPVALQSVLDKEGTRARDLKARLGLRKQVSTTLLALSELHHFAEYERGGRPHYQTVYDNPWRNAQAFVNIRHQVKDLPGVFEPKAAKIAEQPKLKPQKKVTFKLPKKVTFARTESSISTDSSASIDRGGLSFMPGEPISVTQLMAKLDKVVGKKADR